jgi:hypothetical protein
MPLSIHVRCRLCSAILPCLSRKYGTIHTFDFFQFPPHAGSVDSSIFRHSMVRRFLSMLPVISTLLACVAGLFRSRASLCLEHLALRHQLAVYQQTIHHPQVRPSDHLFWAWLSRATVEPAEHTWPPCRGPGGPRAHPGNVAGESHLGLASDCRRAAEARH